ISLLSASLGATSTPRGVATPSGGLARPHPLLLIWKHQPFLLRRGHWDSGAKVIPDERAASRDERASSDGDGRDDPRPPHRPSGLPLLPLRRVSFRRVSLHVGARHHAVAESGNGCTRSGSGIHQPLANGRHVVLFEDRFVLATQGHFRRVPHFSSVE